MIKDKGSYRFPEKNIKLHWWLSNKSFVEQRLQCTMTQIYNLLEEIANHHSMTPNHPLYAVGMQRKKSVFLFWLGSCDLLFNEAGKRIEIASSLIFVNWFSLLEKNQRWVAVYFVLGTLFPVLSAIHLWKIQFDIKIVLVQHPRSVARSLPNLQRYYSIRSHICTATVQ